MKYLLIFGFIVGCCSMALSQEIADKPVVPSSFDPADNTLNTDPLYLRSIGGSAKIISKDEFEKIDAEDINYIKIITDPSSIYIYGDKGKNGVMLIVMKSTFSEKYSGKKRRQK